MFSIWQWIGIGADYLLAGAMLAGGVYLYAILGANPLNPLTKLFHYLGLLLIVCGVLLGSYTYGKSVGATACEAAWKAKNYEAQIARLKQEAEAKSVAAETAAQEAQSLADKDNEQQRKLADYEQKAKQLASACRLPSADDDRRMCDITGNSAAGCGHSD